MEQRFRLIQGDCAKVMASFADKQFDLALLDPPYGIGENQKRVLSREQLAKPIDYGFFDWDYKLASAEAIAHIRRVSKHQIIWGGNYYALPPSSGWLVWDKENSGDFADCELAWTSLPKAVRIFRHMWNGFLRASEKDTKRVHPAQKPELLMQWCIEQADNPLSIIDPYMGSGTAGVAAVRMGIQYVGIEINEKYFDIALKRITDAARAADGLPKQLRGKAADLANMPLFAAIGD